MTDENSIKMMEQLMSKTPEIRLGSSFAMLKSNKWFNQLDWVIYLFLNSKRIN